MRCEQAREQLADYLAGDLDDRAQREIREHLTLCAWCREEAAMWDRLGALAAEEPSPALRDRFEAALAAYREGLEQARPARRRPRLGAWLDTWWPDRPAFQLAIALGTMAVGLAAGYLLFSGRRGSDEIARLREEVRDTRELVTLTLLQQQSAGDRLRGVTYSYRVSQPDPDVLAALLRTLNYDTSPDVRLSALDALHRFGREGIVRRGLVDSLGRQQSPLVQIAVIDTLVDMRERDAAGVLVKLREDRGANEMARQRAAWALAQLKQGGE
jgi:hypothetical protein